MVIYTIASLGLAYNYQTMRLARDELDVSTKYEFKCLNCHSNTVHTRDIACDYNYRDGNYLSFQIDNSWVYHLVISQLPS
jgi:hypothetical protein